MKVYKHKMHGYLVELSHQCDTNAETIHYFPQGGGFERKMDRADFLTLFEPAPAPVMRRGTVTADFLPDDVALPCWADDRRWNGWGMPYFDRATVDRLMALGCGPMEWQGNNVVCNMGDDPEDIDIYEPTTAPDGSQIWGVGAGYWTWDGVKFGDEK